MPSAARSSAYRVLRAVNTGQADLPAALARSRASLADDRDRALAAAIATGTLRWRAALDHVVAQFARRPLDHVDPEVLDVLRLSAYQLLYLDRIPPAAAVNEGVRLAAQAGKRSAAGFVNAVLRAIAGSRDRPPLPAGPDAVCNDADRRAATLDYLSITLSHPRWLAARWLERYGVTATEAWARFNNAEAPLTLRANGLKTTVEMLAARLREHHVTVNATRYAPDGLVVTAGNPLQTPLAGSGLFFVQDEAAQLVALLAQARPGERVLDACASPGGKTTAMAADMNNHGLIVATDIRGRRLDLLRRTIETSGATCVTIVRLDLRRALPFRNLFDCVLVDAPCSGLGTLRRDPEIRWRRAETDLSTFADTQQSMLGRAAGVVRPGGRLVYATCSSEPEENEDVVASFLAAHPSFALIDPRHRGEPLPAGLEEVLDDRGCLRTLPHLHGLEAFFGAVIERATAT